MFVQFLFPFQPCLFLGVKSLALLGRHSLRAVSTRDTLEGDTAFICESVGVTRSMMPYPPRTMAAEVNAMPAYRRRDISHSLIDYAQTTLMIRAHTEK